jgi:transcription initiation factor IIE alpha subunit
MENTRDLSKFGYRELQIAGKLLTVLKTERDKTKYLSDGIAVEFNPSSGCVFLVDENCQVAMLNGEELEDFFSCPECGAEGFLEDIKNHSQKKACKDYIKQITEYGQWDIEKIKK